MPTLRCTEPFAFQEGQVQRVVRAGDLVDADDPLIKGREQWFESVEVSAERFTDRGYESTATAPPEATGNTVVSDAPPKAGAGSSRDAWVAYAESKGVTVTDDMTRDDIVAAVEAADAD
jgi:hypothetical protein